MTKHKPFNQVKPGDKIFTIGQGWDKVLRVSHDPKDQYPVKTDTESYTIEGFRFPNDEYPCAWTYNPFDPNDKPPCEFTKGQKVLVWDNNEKNAQRRYFSHMDDGLYCCFRHGTTEWSTNERPCFWHHCKPYEEEQQEPQETPSCEFKPGEVVFVRDDETDSWECDIFKYYDNSTVTKYVYECERDCWAYACKLTPAERGEVE